MYEVKDPPKSGRLSLTDDIHRPIFRFTQADVSNRRLVYFHSSQSSNSHSQQQDDFYFSVSDQGGGQPVHRHFRIIIVPLELTLINSTAIAIDQGTTTGYVTSENLGCSTNGQRALTFYNVTRQPKGGQLYMNEKATNYFSQVHNPQIKE